MGQEASLPAGVEDLEEQARAPPSSTNNPPSRPAGRRVMNAVFQRSQNHPQPTPQALQDDPYEGRESARAPASAGNYYGNSMNDNRDVWMDSGSASLDTGYLGDTSTTFPPQQQSQQQSQQQHHPVVGVMYEKSPKKGIFQGRSTGGKSILNSMRNLSLGGRKQKEAHEWERQWDEDDDESDDDNAQDHVEQTSSTAMAASTMTAPDSPRRDDALQTQLTYPGQATPSSPPMQFEPANYTQEEYNKQVRVMEDDDGLEWDTGTATHPSDTYKPSIQMFMPMLRVLGKGSFGKVVLVQKHEGKEKGQLFAMKILRKSHLVKRRQIERTRTERKVLSVVNHPFIMKLHYAFQSDDKLYLVLDYCPGGELFFHLSRFRRFPERVARFFAAELVLALGHLHKRGIIYRDLKPENVLLDADGHIKLGDFGLAKAGIKHPFEGASSMCGTPEYMAPEVLFQQGHGFCVDYWGLGMLVYEMMTGLPPWYTTDRSKLFKRLKSAPLEIPSFFSQASAHYVGALLERNPRRRLGVTGIRAAMEHDFFREISWKSLYAKRVRPPILPCEGWKPPDTSDPDHEPGQVHEEGYLEAATANFDNTFTRMPVESEDHGDHSDVGDEELNADTFVGFTFDSVEREMIEANRQRSQNYDNQAQQ